MDSAYCSWNVTTSTSIHSHGNSFLLDRLSPSDGANQSKWYWQFYNLPSHQSSAVRSLSVSFAPPHSLHSKPRGRHHPPQLSSSRIQPLNSWTLESISLLLIRNATPYSSLIFVDIMYPLFDLIPGFKVLPGLPRAHQPQHCCSSGCIWVDSYRWLLGWNVRSSCPSLPLLSKTCTLLHTGSPSYQKKKRGYAPHLNEINVF